MFKKLLILALVLTFSQAQPVPLNQAQRFLVQVYDSSLMSTLEKAKSADDYARAGSYIIASCAVSGDYGNGSKIFYEVAESWSEKTKKEELEKKWISFLNVSEALIWASLRGDIVDHDKEILNNFKNCLATRYNAQKLGISKEQGKLLVKGIHHWFNKFETEYNNANATEKSTIENYIKMIHKARSVNLIEQRINNSGLIEDLDDLQQYMSSAIESFIK